jgi:hypothetical protein
MTPITLVSTVVRTVAGSTVIGICGMPPVVPELLTRHVEAVGALLV